MVAEVRHILLDPVTAVRNMSGEERERREREREGEGEGEGEGERTTLLAIQLNLPLTSQSGQSRWCRGSQPFLSAARDHHLPVPTISYTLTKFCWALVLLTIVVNIF